MMPFLLTAVAIWLTLELAPTTPIGRFLRHWLVAVPARKLSGIRYGAILLALGMVASSVVVAWLLDEEAVRILAMFAPEAATWLSMVEATTIVEAVTAVLVARSAIGLTAVRNWIAGRRPSRPRATRPSRRTPANDQEDDLRRAA